MTVHATFRDDRIFSGKIIYKLYNNSCIGDIQLANLRIPGPIPVDDEILDAMGTEMINHRGPEFKELLYQTTERLQKVFATDQDVFIITGSGTAAMEAAVRDTGKACNPATGDDDEHGTLSALFAVLHTAHWCQASGSLRLREGSGWVVQSLLGLGDVVRSGGHGAVGRDPGGGGGGG